MRKLKPGQNKLSAAERSRKSTEARKRKTGGARVVTRPKDPLPPVTEAERARLVAEFLARGGTIKRWSDEDG